MVARDIPNSFAAIETCPECDSKTRKSASLSLRSRILLNYVDYRFCLGKSNSISVSMTVSDIKTTR